MTDARIVVVDDEVEVLNLLREFLSDCGYEVETASNAIEAEILLASDSVELAFLDVGLHGLRLARKAIAEGKRYILMSGSPVVVEMGEFGEVLQKPFKLAELQRIVERLMREEDRRPAVTNGARVLGLA
jgi:DNA-binding response OmpR family regulator